jgi:hypothetical protein
MTGNTISSLCADQRNAITLNVVRDTGVACVDYYNKIMACVKSFSLGVRNY